MPVYVLLLLVSITTNYATGVAIGRLRDRPGGSGNAASRRVLIAGLVFNLGLLSYFKYANFFLDSLRAVSDLSLPTADVILPIGISFFTFTQIAFLVDTYQKGTREYRFIHYLLFVTYFPHLVAGPVLHHAQMMPQFADPAIYRANPARIAAGLMLFALGLAKKIVVADGVAPYADSVFDATAGGAVPTSAEAWMGALAYTFQLYFDFSGYSDMAVGLSMIFGVKLPYNFASPYRATNISEFWRRWHGAGWTFVVWGGLHGLYLVLHHAVGERMTVALKRMFPATAVAVLAWLLTMLAVVVAWVFFRATDFQSAGTILFSMFGMGAQPGFPGILFNAGLDSWRGLSLIVACTLIAVMPVNSNRIFERHLAACERGPMLTWFSVGAALAAVAALVIVNELRASTSPFIYFNF